MTAIEPPTVREGRAWFIEDVDLEMKMSSESRRANKEIGTLLVGITDDKEREKIIKTQEKILRLKENKILKKYSKPEKAIKADDEDPKDPKEPKA